MLPGSALIIDDDPVFQAVADACLRNLGINDVNTADDGEIGLKRLAENPRAFDVLICDLQMPNLDGVGVIRELSKLGFSGSLIIVSSEQHDIVRTVHAMAQIAGIRVLGTLCKPMAESDLQAMLETESVGPTQHEVPMITRHALKSALANGHIHPAYQPKLNLKTRKLDGVEVLARVAIPGEHSSDPAPYLQAAENEGLTVPFALAMLEYVIHDIKRWRAARIAVNIALNISPASLTHLDLPDELATRCRAANIDPRTVTLEITENRFLDYSANVLDVLSRFRLFGFHLSMDDFGTGATSIDQMRLYPFNELKIDKSFIQTALTDDFSRTTVETSARLAAMLGLNVVAEGVETREHLQFVTEAGAHSVQGYLISEALTANDLMEWIQRRKGRQGQTAA